MCGIAGLIHRGKSTNVGGEMQKMLQSLKHRGPDSTGYALYGNGKSKDYILRFKVGENVKEGSSAIMEDASEYDLRKKEVNKQIVEAGAQIIKEEQITLIVYYISRRVRCYLLFFNNFTACFYYL